MATVSRKRLGSLPALRAAKQRLPQRLHSARAFERQKSCNNAGTPHARRQYIRGARDLSGCRRRSEAVEAWQGLYRHLHRHGLAGGMAPADFRRTHGEVTSVFLSADGRYALSGSEDKTLRLWEVSQWSLPADLRRTHAECHIRFPECGRPLRPVGKLRTRR